MQLSIKRRMRNICIVSLIIMIIMTTIMSNASLAAGAADSDPGTSLGNGTGTDTTGSQTTTVKDAIEKSGGQITEQKIKDLMKKQLSDKSDAEIDKLYNAATNDSTKIKVTYTKAPTGLYTLNTVNVTFSPEEMEAVENGTYNPNLGTKQDPTTVKEEDSELEGADKGDAGGVLFGPIAWLLQGIGDVANQMIQRVLTGSWERVFYDTGFGTFNDKKVQDVVTRNQPIGSLSTVKVVKYFIEGWTKSYGIPEIRITPAEIFAGNVAALDANFFEDDADISNKLGGDEFSIVLKLKPVVAKWYVAIRNIAIVGLLSVLLYIGIRIIVSSSAGDKAKYKQLFIDWVVALCLIFFMHYIMSFTMTMSETITDVLAGSETPQQGTIKQVNIQLTEKDGNTQYGNIYFSSNFAGVARIKADYQDSALKMGYSILYIILTGYTVYFAFVYLKRLVMLAFFTMIAPLVALTYPIDKVKDGKAQAFNYWFKEYMFYALLQPMHMVLYTVLIGSALDIATTNLLYAIVAFACIVPAEKIVKQMFGIKGQTESAISGFAGGALASQAFNTIKSLGKGKTGPSNPAGNAANNGIRMPNDPNRPNAMDTLTSDAMNIDPSTINTASAAMIGGGAGAALANENEPSANNENGRQEVDGQEVIPGFIDGLDTQTPEQGGTTDMAGGNPERQAPNTPTPQSSTDKGKYEALKKQIKSMPGNFGKAVQRRWVAAGGMKGVAKKAAKGYVKAAGAVTGAALGASMGAIGGDVNNLWQAGAAGLAAGNFVGNRANRAISNAGNSSAGRFAKEVAWGDDYQKREFINQYMNSSANRQRIMEENPNISRKDLNDKMMTEANMMSDSKNTDYAVTQRAIKMENDMVAEQEKQLDKNLSKQKRDEKMNEIRERAHKTAASYANLEKNYDKNTFTDSKKYENAQRSLQQKFAQQLADNGINDEAQRNKLAEVEATKTLENIRKLKKL